MHHTSANSEGCSGIPKTKSELPEEHSQEPLLVTQEAIEAYEKRTGFCGIGKIMVDAGHWVIVSKEDLAKSRAQIHAHRTMTVRQRGTA
jgi:hypothetical protein